MIFDEFKKDNIINLHFRDIRNTLSDRKLSSRNSFETHDLIVPIL
jgi:hypothetical protein